MSMTSVSHLSNRVELHAYVPPWCKVFEEMIILGQTLYFILYKQNK